MIPFMWYFTIGRSVGTENRYVIARGWRERYEEHLLPEKASDHKHSTFSYQNGNSYWPVQITAKFGGMMELSYILIMWVVQLYVFVKLIEPSIRKDKRYCM